MVGREVVEKFIEPNFIEHLRGYQSDSASLQRQALKAATLEEVWLLEDMVDCLTVGRPVIRLISLPEEDLIGEVLIAH